MIRLSLAIALAACFSGCHKPIQTVMRGYMTTLSQPVQDMGPLKQWRVVPGTGETDRKIALVDVDGLLVNSNMSGMDSFGENPVSVFREKLDCIARDPCVCAVVLRINSYGGGVTATDIMRHDLVGFKARTGLPVIACLMDVGTGGAYYLATAADHIVAHPTSITGGMGVILNLYNLEEAMLQFNIIGMPIKSGKFVDLGSPIRAPTEDGREILQRVADDFHKRYQAVVQSARPNHDPSAKEDFDGRIFTAFEAEQRQLVDSVGYLDDAIQFGREFGGCIGARVVILHRCQDKARTPYAMSPNIPLTTSAMPISLPGFERTKLPTFLYIWQPEPTIERLQGK